MSFTPATKYVTPTIKSFSAMRFVGDSSTTAIKASYSPNRCYALTTNCIPELQQHHMNTKIRGTWAKRTEPLWWSCATAPDVGTKKRVVRSLLARRLRLAFVESLRVAGYAKDGTRLPGNYDTEDLKCCLQLCAKPEILTMKDVELRTQTDALIRILLGNLEKEKNGKKNIAGNIHSAKQPATLAQKSFITKVRL